MIWIDLLLALGLRLLPFYLDRWFHDPETFELRKAVYATRWQRWMMDNRNRGRFGSLGLVFVATASLPTDYVQSLPTLTAFLSVLAAIGFVSFMAFQILPHSF